FGVAALKLVEGAVRLDERLLRQVGRIDPRPQARIELQARQQKQVRAEALQPFGTAVAGRSHAWSPREASPSGGRVGAPDEYFSDWQNCRAARERGQGARTTWIINKQAPTARRHRANRRIPLRIDKIYFTYRAAARPRVLPICASSSDAIRSPMRN